MNRNYSLGLYFLVISVLFSSCRVVGDIFKAGFWSAIIIIVIVVALILWLVGRSRQ